MIAKRGGDVTKIAAEKIKPTFSIFFQRDFRLPLTVLQWLWGGRNVCLGDKNHERKKKNSNWCFQFFQPWFSSTNFTINSFENLKFSKLFDEDAISRIRGSWDCDGGNWGTKIAAEKIGNVIFGYDFRHLISPIAIAGPSNSIVMREEWMTKIAAKKNRRLRSWLAFLWRLPTFSPNWMTKPTGLLRRGYSAQPLHRFGRATCSVDAPLLVKKH